MMVVTETHRGNSEEGTIDADPAPHPLLTIDYDAAVELLFVQPPEGTPLPAPVVNARPARRLRDAMEPIALHGAWCRRTNQVLTRLGLTIFTGYVWGRAAVLGEPPAEVVAAVFATFEPGLVIAAYEEARRQCGRAGLLAAREEATIESLAEVLNGLDVAGAVAALRRGVDAADGTGRPLFTGLRSLSWPDHPVGQLWRACDLLREHRTEGHVAACISTGLGPVAMNVMTELWLGMSVGQHTMGYRGWSEVDVSLGVADLEARGLVADRALTPAGRHLRDDIEERTDAMQQSVIDAIGSDFEATVTSLDAWSTTCIEAGSFPPDIFKRATG
jgi:hypothetical protein